MSLNEFKWVHVNFAGSRQVPLIDIFLNGSKWIWVLNVVGLKWGGFKWARFYHLNISSRGSKLADFRSAFLQISTYRSLEDWISFVEEVAAASVLSTASDTVRVF